ncbi:MAG: hypothetical protein ACE5D7_08070 [Fidelibacterota bacterium]
MDQNILPFDSSKVEIQFVYHIENDFSEYTYLGSLILGELRKRFRYTLGPKTTIFDGKDWFLSDERTNQVLIEGGNESSIMSIPVWVNSDSIKTLQRYPAESEFEWILDLPEVSDNVIVSFSKMDTSLEQIIFGYELSEVRITDIVLTIPDSTSGWFSVDTTGKTVLDLRE